MSERIQIGAKTVTFVYANEVPPNSNMDGVVVIPRYAKVDAVLEDVGRQKVSRLIQSPGVTVLRPSGSQGEAPPYKRDSTTDFIGLGVLGLANQISLGDTHPAKYYEQMLIKAQDEWGWKVTFTAWTSVVNPIKAAGNIFRYKTRRFRKKSTK